MTDAAVSLWSRFSVGTSIKDRAVVCIFYRRRLQLFDPFVAVIPVKERFLPPVQ